MRYLFRMEDARLSHAADRNALRLVDARAALRVAHGVFEAAKLPQKQIRVSFRAGDSVLLLLSF